MAEPALNIDASFDTEEGAGDAALASRRQLVAGAVDGLDALHLAEMASAKGADVFLHVARDAGRANQLVDLIKFLRARPFRGRFSRLGLPAL